MVLKKAETVAGRNEVVAGIGVEGGWYGTVGIDKADADYGSVVKKTARSNPYPRPTNGETPKLCLFNGSQPMMVLGAPTTSPPKPKLGGVLSNRVLQ